MIDETAPIRRDERVVQRVLGDGGSVLLHLDTGAYHGLNPVGAQVWDAIDGVRAAPEIVAEVRARVSGAPDTVGEEIRAFLEALHERGLIVG